MSNDSLRDIDKILDEVEFNMFTAPRNDCKNEWLNSKLGTSDYGSNETRLTRNWSS